MKRFRVYADTSVYGGCFDVEFEAESRAFFEAVRRGRFELVISPTVLSELQRAPEQVRRIPAEWIPRDTHLFAERGGGG